MCKRFIFMFGDMKRCRKWSGAASVLLILGFTCIGCQSAGLQPRAPRYISLIDAGSSGSRLYVYSIHRGDLDHLPEFALIHSKKVRPGISTYEEDPDRGKENLSALIQAAKKVIPVNEQSTTPFHLLATAGMRLLSEAKRTRILKEIQNLFLSEGSFAYHPPAVISGRYEGLYSWVAINYLDDGFDPKQRREGILEMGGASTQIAYLAPAGSAELGIERRIRNRLYRIYARSFLYMGENIARQLTATPHCFPQGFPQGIGEGPGAGDFQRCAREIRESFIGLCENLEMKTGPHCIFRNPPPSPPPGDYIALSAYFFLFDFLVEDVDKHLAKIYYDQGETFCARNWDELVAAHAGIPDQYLKNYCFDAAYYWSLLVHGYGFNSKDHRIRAKNEIGGTEVSWTLGAAIDIELGHKPEPFSNN